ncbi:hypothetical protein DBV15_09598 [Temnothorax longispinosus]|uniref:Uncharacterized protein n=1 Tax=Temnothorax longispinosus TaxID=300112 RepID=A0A4S2KEK7_9HYME|nr:hypothetical protein DBV15_09598 [Temnothorax longispinosus]
MKVLSMLPRNPTRLKLSLVICRMVPAERWKVFPCITRASNLMYVQLWGQNCQMLMTSMTGHLLGYEFTGAYSKSAKQSSLISVYIEQNSRKLRDSLSKELFKLWGNPDEAMSDAVDVKSELDLRYGTDSIKDHIMNRNRAANKFHNSDMGQNNALPDLSRRVLGTVGNYSRENNVQIEKQMETSTPGYHCK